jgi:hypothetical protein
LWISFFAVFFAAQDSTVTFEALLKVGRAQKKNFQELLQSEKRRLTFALPK